ncbi:MAG: MerR family transcriptional regulator [Spirochaetales bacterium]|nr:MerR family transcriptional regulator [Candidatus Physcosoma equi]
MAMTIKEVCTKYQISPDTLRYYEKVGVIPTVHRSRGGIREFTEEDIGWVENAICFRDAGMSVEDLAEYVRLFQEGDETILSRTELLRKVREDVKKSMEKYQKALSKLDYKIRRYEEAERTGVLSWDTLEDDKENYR